jgi:hypothetical protein
MHTKLLTTITAVVLGLAGLVLTFAPQEMLAFCGGQSGWFVLLIVQVTGALYLGFAMVNWMVRDNLIGGIYSRPVVVGNLIHFAMVALVLVRSLFRGDRSETSIVAFAVYVILAVWFGLVLLRHPSTGTKK